MLLSPTAENAAPVGVLATRAGGGVRIGLAAKGMELVLALGWMPEEVVGALRVRILDLVAHQRFKAGESITKGFGGGRKLQKLWFARSYQFTKNAAESIDQLGGESFAVGIEGAPTKFWQLLETGGRIAFSSPAIIPFKLKSRGSWPVFSRDFGPAGSGRFFITRDGYVIEKMPGTTGRRRGDVTVLGGGGGPVARGRVVGVMRTSRNSRKLFDFFASFDAVFPRHAAEMEKVFDNALTVSGREAIAADSAAKLQQVLQRLQKPWKTGGARAARTQAAAVAAGTRLAPSIGVTRRGV